jgi:ferredoxin-NADP reductase
VIFRAKVIESRRLTATTHMIRVAKPSGFTYRPVQFCGLELATAQGAIEYPMSLACAPTRDSLEFGARLSDSPWKQAFAALQPGDEVEVDGPFGHFVLDETRDAVFVAGGIGITPLKGMAEHLTDTDSQQRAVLVYSNRSQDEIAYRAELDALAKANPRLRVVHTLTREPEASGWKGRRGRIDAALLKEATATLREPKYYLCGKGAMVMGAGQQLVDLGVSRERIAFEVFRGYE